MRWVTEDILVAEQKAEQGAESGDWGDCRDRGFGLMRDDEGPNQAGADAAGPDPGDL